MNFGDKCWDNIRDYSKPHGLDGRGGHGGDGRYDCYKKNKEQDNFLLFTPRSTNTNYNININYDCHHHTPSWKTTLFAGFTNFAFTGLAVWGLSKLFGRIRQNAQQPQTQVQQNDSLSLYLKGLFDKSTITVNPTQETTPPGDTNPNGTTPLTDPPNPNPNPTPNPSAATEYDGQVTHGSNETIEGTIPAESVKYENQEETSKKYPSEFVIYDKQNNSVVDVDGNTNGDIKGNKYTFTFVKVENNNAIYKLAGVIAVKADGSEETQKFNPVQYEVDDSSWDKTDTNKFAIKSDSSKYDIKMKAIANQPQRAVDKSLLKNPTTTSDSGTTFTVSS